MKRNILEKKIQKNFSIIIPSKRIDKYLIKCIQKIKSFYPKIEIILMLDDTDNINSEIRSYNNIIILKSKKKNIAFKRNFAAKKTKKIFLVFIDSDAFPTHHWLNYYYDKILKNKIVGGPNISYTTNEEQKLVAKSRLLSVTSLNTNYKKKSNKIFNVNFLPACNLAVEKKLYLKLGGMNENVITGEENSFYQKLKKKGIKILMVGRGYVMHQERNIMEFLYQRMSYGSSIIAVFIDSPNFMILAALISSFNLVYLLLILIMSIIQIKFLFLLIPLVFLSAFITLNISKNNLFKSFIVSMIIIFGQSLGFLISFFGFRNFYKLYKHNK